MTFNHRKLHVLSKATTVILLHVSSSLPYDEFPDRTVCSPWVASDAKKHKVQNNKHIEQQGTGAGVEGKVGHELFSLQTLERGVLIAVSLYL